MTGEQLRRLRKRAGATQGLVSQATGILTSNLCKMERGHRKISPKTERRIRLALRRLSRGEFHIVCRLAARQVMAVLGRKRG